MGAIFRPRQSIQRITANAGNTRVIAGGIGINRAIKPVEAAPAPPPPAPPPKSKAK